MSSFVIKIIAIICMLCDHSGDLLIGHLSIFNMIGRIAFPLFAFQITIGYKYTHNLKNYMMRIFIFALISQIPYSIMNNMLSGSCFALNIFFTLFLGLSAIYIYDNFAKIYKSNKFLSYLIKFVLIVLIMAFSYFINTDYSIFGIALILFIYIFYDKNKLFFSIGYFILCLFGTLSYARILSFDYLVQVYIFLCLPLIFMLFYNGKKGPSAKYFFYAFYPLHIIILEIIHCFLF